MKLLAKLRGSPAAATLASMSALAVMQIAPAGILWWCDRDWELSLWMGGWGVFLFFLAVGASLGTVVVRQVAYQSGEAPGPADIAITRHLISSLYGRLALSGAGLFAITVSLLLWPILRTDITAGLAAIAWMTAAIGLALYGGRYQTVVEGGGGVAWLRWWDACLFAVAALIMCAAISTGFGVASVMLLVPSCWLIRVAKNRSRVSGRHANYSNISPDEEPVDDEALSRLHRDARNAGVAVGIGQLMTGLLSAGLIWLVPPDDYVVALVAFRGVELVSRLAQPVFYASIPMFASLYAADRFADLDRALNLASRRLMFVFIALAMAGLGVIVLLTVVVPDAPMPPAALWVALTLGLFLERFAGMAMQIHAVLTNVVIWHITSMFYLLVGFGAAGIGVVSNWPGAWPLAIGILLGNAIGFVPVAYLSLAPVLRRYRLTWFQATAPLLVVALLAATAILALEVLGLL